MSVEEEVVKESFIFDGIVVDVVIIILWSLSLSFAVRLSACSLCNAMLSRLDRVYYCSVIVDACGWPSIRAAALAWLSSSRIESNGRHDLYQKMAMTVFRIQERRE